MRFYFAAQRASRLREQNLVKHPQMSFYQGYQLAQAKGQLSGFPEEYPSINFDLQEKLPDELIAEIAQLSLPEFVEMLLPGKVKDPKFFTVLEKQYENVLYQCYCLYVLLRISPDLSPGAAYEQYCTIYSGKDEPMTPERFRRLYCLMNWQQLRDESIIKASAKEANRLLTSLLVSNRKKCEIVAETLSRLNKLKSKEMQAPASYLAKILYDDK